MLQEGTSIGSFPDQDQDITLLPKKQIGIVAFITLSEPIELVFLFPFVYFMVQDFGVASNEDLTGLYVGILSASFPASQFLTSYFLGYLSDKLGRKPILLLGVLGSGLAMIGFGFSTSYWMALSFRTLAGLLNGTMGSAKTIVGEITDNTNRSAAFSIIGLVTGIGFIIGPIIGGFLADPASQYPDVFGDIGFFNDFPYSLPCMLTGAFNITAAILGVFLLEESLPRLKKQNIYRLPESSLPPTKPTATEIIRTIATPSVLLCVLVYALVAFETIILDEAFAIWAVEDIDNHGLNFSSQQVGLVLTFGGFTFLLAQTLIYPFISRHVGPVTTFKLSMLFSVPVFVCFPFLSAIVQYEDDQFSQQDDTKSNIILWSLLLLLVAVRTTLIVTSFTSSIIIVSNSVISRFLGTVNGFGQTLASGFRAIAAFSAGSLWAWSLINGLSFPFDHFFVFFIGSGICLLAFLLSVFLPATLNKAKLDLVVEELLLEPTESVQSYASTLNGDCPSVNSFGSLLFADKESNAVKSHSFKGSFLD